MFPELDPLLVGDDALKALADTMVDGSGDTSRDHTTLPAGYTFLGQFVDHDVTFDPTSLKEVTTDPASLINYRTPALDLDHLYGRGPSVDPQYYRRGRSEVFLSGPDGDLPRLSNWFAVIPDRRNDENLAISQLHVLFQKFHNAVVRGLQPPGLAADPDRLPWFHRAREIVLWHYHWIVLRDFLPRILNPEVLRSVRTYGSTVFDRRGPFMPVEFSAAAWRFGHSLIPPSVNLNAQHNKVTLAELFQLAGAAGDEKLPFTADWAVDWQRLFDSESPDVCYSRQIDPYLAPALFRLTNHQNPSLAWLNLKRGVRLGLPSGQSVARRYGLRPLAPEAIASSGEDGKVAERFGLHINSPLWYYVLKEAQLQETGLRLGEVGSWIVAETVVGLIEQDPTSFLTRDPRWEPHLDSKVSRHFTMTDLVNFARPDH